MLKSRYDVGVTPYHWTQSKGGGWRIGFGVSSFLIATGSGYSTRCGKKLLRELQDEWLKRVKARRPINKKRGTR